MTQQGQNDKRSPNHPAMNGRAPASGVAIGSDLRSVALTGNNDGSSPTKPLTDWETSVPSIQPVVALLAPVTNP